MSTAVSFERGDEFWYVVHFAYDEDLIAMVKTVPSVARTWNRRTKEWTVTASYARRLAKAMKELGYLLTGLDPPEPAQRQHNGYPDPDDWARLLLKQVGPERAEAVFRSLSRVLHPDNPDTGNTKLQQDLNTARAEMERKP